MKNQSESQIGENVFGVTITKRDSNKRMNMPSSPKKEIDNKRTKQYAIRKAGGETWVDHSLEEWDPNDYRIFCGNLGNEVTDDLLFRSFSRYSSIVKARVVRDKHTDKSKGYGFVSFKQVQDFISAMREMDGKYIGNRPVKLKKSTWQDRTVITSSKKEYKDAVMHSLSK